MLCVASLALLLFHACALSAAQPSFPDGQYQTAISGAQNPDQPGFIYVSSDFGSTWTKANAPQLSWTAIAMSATGQFQTAVANLTGPSYAVFVSFTFGNTWQPVLSSSLKINKVAVTANGDFQLVTAANGTVLASYDYGYTWDALSQIPIPESGGQLLSITASTSGQYLTATVEFGQIFFSKNYGRTWYAADAPEGNKWATVSMSAQGKYQNALANNGFIYTSSNSGLNWTQVSAAGLRFWQQNSVSASGQYQSVACSRCGVWTSTNYGRNFTEVTSGLTPDNWNAISVSFSGRQQIVGACNIYDMPGNVYTSNDFGQSWQLSTLPQGCWLVALNRNSGATTQP